MLECHQKCFDHHKFLEVKGFSYINYTLWWFNQKLRYFFSNWVRSGLFNSSKQFNFMAHESYFNITGVNKCLKHLTWLGYALAHSTSLFNKYGMVSVVTRTMRSFLWTSRLPETKRLLCFSPFFRRTESLVGPRGYTIKGQCSCAGCGSGVSPLLFQPHWPGGGDGY